MRMPRDVNPYKKVAAFCKLCVQSSIKVSITFWFISDEHIVKQSKTSVLQNNIYK